MPLAWRAALGREGLRHLQVGIKPVGKVQGNQSLGIKAMRQVRLGLMQRQSRAAERVGAIRW